MRVRGHNLVWQNQLPSWVSSLPQNQVQAAMESHITTEVSHYKGQIYAWDVVNEPFNGDGSLVSDAFYKAMGSGYIADALRTAHAADPAAQLYLNDYSIEGENAKSNAMYSLVQSLLAQGVPINGVGFESHYIVGQVPSSLLANMQRFAALGVNVAVTELDDRIEAAQPVDEERRHVLAADDADDAAHQFLPRLFAALRTALAPFLGAAGLRHLAAARDRQRVGRHVAGDDAAGGDDGAVADRDRRHQRRRWCRRTRPCRSRCGACRCRRNCR